MKKITTPLSKKDLENVLDEKLKNYATKKDLYNLEKNLEKKLDARFTKRLQESLQAFRNENNHTLQVVKVDILEGMSKFTNMVLTAIDPLIKYVDERREEKEIEAHQLHETRTQLDNHEKRIKKLEQS
ncbi:MAG TPA: hypothetical protein VLG67_00695 [Candidatus Saccharimonadales bacterium]|nr:hypothetical protein [Candidatus Saccharimonadales bacterium]